MSITKTYAFSTFSFPEKVMPVDLAMNAQNSAPISPLLAMSSSLRASTPALDYLQRLSPPSPTSSLSSTSSGSSLSSYSPGTGTLRKKKRVVFADAKGLRLTYIRYFTTHPLEAETEDIGQPEERLKSRTVLQNNRPRVKLGFSPPVADCGSLKENLVQLESCSVTEKVLRGTVRVRNIKFDKTVFVRVTFDSWRSHRDIPCAYIREQQATLETDLFAFNVFLPIDLDPKERFEFFVIFRSGSSKMQFLDNNKGKNYLIHVENVLPLPESRSGLESYLVASETRPVVSDSVVATESRLGVSEPHLVGQSRRNFHIPSPPRHSAWPGTKDLYLHRMKSMPCKGSQSTERLASKAWGGMIKVVPSC